MSITAGIAIYLVIWWIVLFAVLPWGVRTQGEAGDVVPGSESSAPVAPFMLRKVIATTIVSALVFGVFYWAFAVQGYSLQDLPDLLG